MPKAKYRLQRTCQYCNQLFLARSINSRYCSDRCSDAAYRQRKRDQREENRLRAKAEKIPASRTYLTIAEAESTFLVSKRTLYRMIRKGILFRYGCSTIKLSRRELSNRYQLRATAITELPPTPILYRLEPDDCYTIGEISRKFGVSPSTVYTNIRKYSVPIRQIGKEVYAPKSEIDRIFS